VVVNGSSGIDGSKGARSIWWCWILVGGS
jgi:hypothetical protein